MHDIDYIRRRGRSIIEDYIGKVGWAIIPGMSRLALRPHITKMISKINEMAGVNPSKSFAEELSADFIDGWIDTHFKTISHLHSRGCSNGLSGIDDCQSTVELAGAKYLGAVISAAEEANRSQRSLESLIKDFLKSDRYYILSDF